MAQHIPARHVCTLEVVQMVQRNLHNADSGDQNFYADEVREVAADLELLDSKRRIRSRSLAIPCKQW